MEETMFCIVDSHHGIYIPQLFVEYGNMDHWHIKPEDVAIIARGPDTEHYWETWDDVLNSAYCVDSYGVAWTLHHDGDLFAVSAAHEWEEVMP